jgi:hypothetical protein
MAHDTFLRELLVNARSKNAGPFTLTIDLFVRTREDYEAIRESDAVTPDTVGAVLNVPPVDIRVFFFEPALAIKISMPREVSSGAPGDRDLFGGQQFPPLLDLRVPGTTDERTGSSSATG